LSARIALVGAGWAADLHLTGFRRAGAEVVGVYSRTRHRAVAFAERHGLPVVADSLTELIERTRPDVVSIASPPPAHQAQLLEAVAASCHVLCDKPVAMNAEQAARMLAAAESAGVRHASGFIWRGDPGLGRMRELLAQGRLGTLRELHSTCALGAPRMAMNWIYDESAGGGGLMQHGTHVLDRVRWLLGAEAVELVGRVARDVADAPVGPEFHHTLDAFRWAAEHRDADDGALPRAAVTADVGYDVLAEFDNGVRARLWESTHLSGPQEEEISVLGDRGTLTWSGSAGLRLIGPGGAVEPIPVAGAAGSGANTPHEIGLRRWELLAAAFLASIEGDQTAQHPDLRDGWQVARLVDAIRRSDRTRRWEKV
jgi:predicted dehydrogenase